MFLSSSSAHAITKQSKHISLNQLIRQVYSPPFVMAASLLLPHPYPPPTIALTYPLALFNPILPFPSLISSFSQCQASRPSPPCLFRLVFLFSIFHRPLPPQPIPLTLPEFHTLVCLRWNKSTSRKATSRLLFFSLFYRRNPFNLLPQQLIKHSNKTSVLPPFPTSCPSSVSVKWWMAARSGRQLWCNDTTAMAFFFTPWPPSKYVSAWGSLTKHKYKEIWHWISNMYSNIIVNLMKIRTIIYEGNGVSSNSF